MIFVGALLCAIALADITRSQLPGNAPKKRLAALLVGTITVITIALIANLLTGADLLRLLLAALTMAAWVVTSDETMASRLPPAAPLSVLTIGAVLMLLLGGASNNGSGGIEQWLMFAGLADRFSPDRVVLLVGLLLLQTSTANVVVRLVLTHVGALKSTDSPQASDKLRGGRLLGPMERLIILGLGLAGEVTAASLVIAAKGLIRWPEIQSSRSVADKPRGASDPGIDEVTEYFLVGSMVSWIFALASLAIVTLSAPL
ncbi:hypothetical protein K0651_01485 [Ornithinimicrobium sp. Arc0846-15]|nr:hypothetical protein [Ornithinimicrobium laminariae]